MKPELDPERESIAGRIVEFLRLHQPFEVLVQEQLLTLANTSSMHYLDKGETIFKAGDPLHDGLYILRKGSIKVIDKEGALVDQCGEGEIVGARAFMSTETYKASVVADPEALLIKLSMDTLRKVVVTEPKVLEFFFGDFASGVALRRRKLREIDEHFKSTRPRKDFRFNFENSFISTWKLPVTCSAETTIREVAQTMREHRVGSIVVVDDEFRPKGIATDTDLRDKVVTGDHSIEDRIERIMTKPVKTVANGLSTEEYLMEMISLGAHHLCVTQKGTNDEPLLGVVTDHDLLVSRGNNAAVLIKELRRASGDKRKEIVERFDGHVRNLVLHHHPIQDIARIVQAFNRELLGCTIKDVMSAHDFSFGGDDFCWLALGSTARGEQVIRTDFDSAIIFREQKGGMEQELKTFADEVFERLVAYGYETDKAGIQANNPEWILPLEAWELRFRQWIAVPEERALLYATIFFDLQGFFGNLELASALQDTIYRSYKGNKRFTAFLAGNALQNPPPLGFFKNLVLEKGGEHNNTFDIKARAMMPLADAARLQSLEFNTMFPANTIARYQRLAKVDLPNASRYEDCAVAYRIFMRMRAYEGLKHGSNGRFVDPTHLSSLEKQVLKNAFEPISSIQHLIKPM